MNPFAYKQPNVVQVPRIEKTREMFAELYNFILQEHPNTRERSLAITKLEEAAMWAIKGLAFVEDV